MALRDILAADIGGTNSRFGHFRAAPGGGLELVSSKWLPTSEAASFGGLLEMLAGSNFTLAPSEASATAIAVAGPVRGGCHASPPFISWEIDLARAARDFGLKRYILINDFVAQAYACRSPVGERAEVVIAGRPEPGGTAAVIGAGTGLGMALVAPDGRGGFIALPSEGGHADFPFIGPEEMRLAALIRKKTGLAQITGNTVVSGGGISLVHNFLTGEDLEPREVPGALLPGSETLSWVARLYARSARNFALGALATAGLFIAGGVAGRSPEIIRHEEFRAEFLNSPTMGEVLRRIEVRLVLEQESGLWGAAFAGAQMCGPEESGGALEALESGGAGP